MLLMGIDIGTSSIKISVVDGKTGSAIATAQYPEKEADIISHQTGWAEQSPEQWWNDIVTAFKKLNATPTFNPKEIKAIGIAYQMHGLVIVDKNQQVLRDAIIWCDSRAVEIGNIAFHKIGEENCLYHLLNSPGNFTASKLAWIKEQEPEIFEQIDKIMLPGDFIAMKLSGEITTTISALSEGIFWDFRNDELSKDILNYFGFNRDIIPTIKNVFEEHGRVSPAIATELNLTAGIPITYKAGDQPNNALALNVFNSGEVAANAGTSGVIYAISNQLNYDQQSRINSFAHVNYTADEKKIGQLLCINGCGIANKWMKNITGNSFSYEQTNEMAASISAGSDGVQIIPFGNGAERMLNNKIIGAHIHDINFNNHTSAHLIRATQESIAFAFRYGIDIMKENGTIPTVIKAGKANMFLSPVFTQIFADVNNIPVELYHTDGSIGAAIGGGIGAKYYDAKEAFINFKPRNIIESKQHQLYDELYFAWKEKLSEHLTKTK